MAEVPGSAHTRVTFCFWIFLSTAYIVGRRVKFSQACVCSGRGVPQSQVLSQVLGPRSFLREEVLQSQVLSQVLSKGYPSPRFLPRSLVSCPFWGVPQSWMGYPRTGVPPGQVRMRYPPARSGWGNPPARSGYGTPKPGQDGVPPTRSGWGAPPGQNHTANTCYAESGMPLAFTFLVSPAFPTVCLKVMFSQVCVHPQLRGGGV